MKTNFFLTVLLVLVFLSCNNDDDITTSLPESALNELRDETTIALTSSGVTKTWRISQATLTNQNSEIDISQNFNVVDDEFIFGGTTENGTLEWRQGFEIQTNASNSQETLLDKYVASIKTSFSYQNGSSTVVEADFGNCVFQVNDDDSVSATITNEDNTVFDFTLVEKTQADYKTASQSGLNFSSAFTFESNSISRWAPGMIGSYADNSFFIVTREEGLSVANVNPERIFKFDISSNTVSERLFYKSDFVSKQLHIVDNQLIVIGGQRVNTYDLDLSLNPSTVNHGKVLTRFGISVLDDDAYLIGGDVSDVENNKIFKWNLESQTLTDFTTLPEPRSGARGTIVNDYMYVFGGSEMGFGTGTNTIYKVSIDNPSSIETFQMNKDINFTFVQKFQNLIYVAGLINVTDSSGLLIGRESTIGVFNTLDNTYQELASNLTNASGFDTIHQMCIFNGKMYIIYGNEGTDNGGQFNEWDVLVSDLN